MKMAQDGIFSIWTLVVAEKELRDKEKLSSGMFFLFGFFVLLVERENSFCGIELEE